VWVVFAINMFGTIAKRREKHMYVAVWFYIATVVTVAVLHIVNSFEMPLHSPKATRCMQVFKMHWFSGGTGIMQLLFSLLLLF
jgi:cbb3-type cytochrome oxidase subunit 1